MSKVTATKITLMRKGSQGIKGTIINATHHAEDILPYINDMRKEVMKLGFTTWRQGHNVHMFINSDGQRYTLRAFTRADEGYVGIRLSLRVGRSAEYRLIDIDSVDQVPALLETMRLLAVPALGNATALEIKTV